jgi:hypothetical protein
MIYNSDMKGACEVPVTKMVSWSFYKKTPMTPHMKNGYYDGTLSTLTVVTVKLPNNIMKTHK